MNKLKKYSFYIGIVGAILTVVGFILDFFGLINILPMIIEITAILSTILVSLGIVEKDDKGETLKEDIEEDIKSKVDYPNQLKKTNIQEKDNDDKA